MQSLGFIQNFGMTELIIILVVVLIIFGPKSLPKLGRSLGQGIREFRSATNKMSESILQDDEDDSRPRARNREFPRESADSPANNQPAEKETEKVS